MEKSTADTIVSNVHLVSFDDDGAVIADGALAIRDGVIVDRGTTTEVTSRWEATSRVHGGGQLAIPGLTDAHLHTAQTMLRGLLTELQTRTRLRGMALDSHPAVDRPHGHVADGAGCPHAHGCGRIAGSGPSGHLVHGPHL